MKKDMEVIHKKIDHLELEMNHEGVTLPQFTKGDIGRCASCNTDLRKKLGDE